MLAVNALDEAYQEMRSTVLRDMWLGVGVGWDEEVKALVGRDAASVAAVEVRDVPPQEARSMPRDRLAWHVRHLRRCSFWRRLTKAHGTSTERSTMPSPSPADE